HLRLTRLRCCRERARPVSSASNARRLLRGPARRSGSEAREAAFLISAPGRSWPVAETGAARLRALQEEVPRTSWPPPRARHVGRRAAPEVAGAARRQRGGYRDTREYWRC